MKIVTWGKSDAKGGRWGDLVGEALAPLGLKDETPLVYDYGEHDYQGSCGFIARLGPDEYLIYGWSYGSCSGCDGWEAEIGYEDGEDERREGVKDDIRRAAQKVTGATLRVYLENIVRQRAYGSPDHKDAQAILDSGEGK